MSFNYKDKYKYLSSACLNLTDACNLACRYCFVEQHPHFMSLDTAKKAVDFLVSNYKWKIENNVPVTNNKVFINYFGGEPTLLWDEIIVPLTLYAEKYYPNIVEFGITTNGTLLNKERIDFLFEHKIQPLLSIDGAKETQDLNRPCQNGQSSFDLVIKNIPYLLEKFPQTTFRSTIDVNTVEHTFNNYIFASFLGFKKVYMIPNCRENWSIEKMEILKEEVEKIYWFIANSFINQQIPISFSTINDSFEWVLKHDINTLKNIDDSFCTRTPDRCGLGTTFGSIGYDGKIYGCQEQDSKNIKNIFFIGDIFTGIDINLHSNLLKNYSTFNQLICEDKEFCQTCPLRNICTIFCCPSSSWDIFNSFFISSKIQCFWNKTLFDCAIVVMNYLTKENNFLFKEYLDKSCNFKNYWPEGSD